MLKFSSAGQAAARRRCFRTRRLDILLSLSADHSERAIGAHFRATESRTQA
jgi:hypothetical protein